MPIAKIEAAHERLRYATRGMTRSKQIGTGDRSEKIRTYNFPQTVSPITELRKVGTRLQPLGDLQPIIDAIHPPKTRYWRVNNAASRSNP